MDTLIFFSVSALLAFFVIFDVLWRKPQARRSHLPRRAIVLGSDRPQGSFTYTVHDPQAPSAV